MAHGSFVLHLESVSNRPLTTSIRLALRDNVIKNCVLSMLSTILVLGMSIDSSKISNEC